MFQVVYAERSSSMNITNLKSYHLTGFELINLQALNVKFFERS